MVAKGDTYALRREEQSQSGGQHYATRRVERIMVVTSIRKGLVYVRECFHRAEAEKALRYCPRRDYDLDGFEEHLRAWGWKPTDPVGG